MTLAMAELQCTCDHAVLYEVSWEDYRALRERLDDEGRHLQLTYDQGTLEIMSPVLKHEKWKRIIARMLDALLLELDIRNVPLGGTAFAREDLLKGLEPDDCFYIAHAADVEHKDRLDLTQDPPPDLVIEMENTRRVLKKLSIYHSLGAPEVWRFDGETLEFLRRGKEDYKPVQRSGAFPFLGRADFERFLLRFRIEPMNQLLREWRDWIGRQS